MKVGPSESPCGGGFKPPTAALAEDRCGERVGKGALDVSGGDQEDDGCRRVETYKDDIETGVSFRSREEPGGCPPIGQAVSGMEAT